MTALALLLLLLKWSGREKQGDIMDIGMRSFGVEGAGRRGVVTGVGILALSESRCLSACRLPRCSSRSSTRPS